MGVTIKANAVFRFKLFHLLALFGGSTLLNSILLSLGQANQSPYIENIEDQVVTAGNTVEFLVKPVDPDGIVPALFSNNLPPGSEFTDNGNGTRTFRWTVNESHTGVHDILFVTVDAVDPSLRQSQQMSVRVGSGAVDFVATGTIGANAAPVFETLGNQVVVAGNRLDMRVVPRDPEGIVPGLMVRELPDGAEFADNYDGTRSLRWTPREDQSGEHRFVFVAIDATDNSLRTEMEILVVVNATGSSATADSPEPSQPVNEPTNAGNRPPYFENLVNQRVSIGDTLRFVVAPRDADGQVPGMFADRLPANAFFSDNFDGTRTLEWSPYPADRGDFWITFTAIDALDDSVRTDQSIKITVEDNGGYNFEPVINGINNPVIRAGDTLQQLVQPVDPDGDVPRLEVLDPPAGSDFVDNRDGTRTLRWLTSSSDITEFGETDTPHLVHFRATDSRNPELTDDHELKISVVDPDSLNRSGERLRTLADRVGIKIGYAAMLESSKLADAEVYRQIASEEFNIVTPENSHKWGWIQPQRGFFKFEDADELARYAADNSMLLHGHPLLWHRQLPGWVQNLPLDEAEQVMNEHITALVTRYRGQVHIWDVVNEALEEDGSFRQSIWFESMGQGFIGTAFRRARELDPAAVLVYNDYDVAWFNNKSDAMYELLRRELEQGTPIDAVGFQMHFWAQFDDFDEVVQNLQRFANLGLFFYITELDFAVSEDGQEQLQASVYERVARICRQQPRCRAIQAWGFTDRYSWRYNFKPLLFTERYKAKPSYYSLQRALQ